MKVTVSVPGNFQPAYLWARYLESTEQLDRLITPLPYSRVGRFEISRARTSSILSVGVLNYAVRHYGSRRLQESAQPIFSSLFDRRSSRLIGSCDVFNGWASTALFAVRAAHDSGIPAVLQTGSVHIARQAQIIADESSRFGPDEPLPHKSVIARTVAEYEEADAIVVPSQFVLDSFLQRGTPRSKLFLVRWAALPVARRVTRSRSQAGGTILFVGRAGLRKGLPYLLRAFRDLPPSASLRLVGEYNARLLRRLGGLPHGVTLTGPLKGSALASEYQHADLFVLPSLEDGSALVTIEALAAGLPVVVSDQAGADFVSDGLNGFVVPAGDAGALSERLAQLVEDPALRRRMGEAARASVAERTWAEYGRDLDTTVFQRVIRASAAGVAA